MRNVLYPKQVARYIVGEELKKLLQSETPIQRVRAFLNSSRVAEEETTLVEKTHVPAVQTVTVSCKLS
jgi:hypothetical protein